MQGAWELLSDFHARGIGALSDYTKRAGANPYGRVNTRKLTANDRIQELEKFLPATQQRDYENTWGHAPFSEKK